MSDMDTKQTDGISVEQLRKWLNRDAGQVHGCLMANLDVILRLAIERLRGDDMSENIILVDQIVRQQEEIISIKEMSDARLRAVVERDGIIDSLTASLAEAREQLANEQSHSKQLERGLDKAVEQLKKYEGCVESVGTVATDEEGDTVIFNNDLGGKWLEEFLGQPVTVWVKRREE